MTATIINGILSGMTGGHTQFAMVYTFHKNKEILPDELKLKIMVTGDSLNKIQIMKTSKKLCLQILKLHRVQVKDVQHGD